MFLYYNATILKPILIPLLEQQSDTAQFPYASKDLGMSSLHFFVIFSPHLSDRYDVSKRLWCKLARVRSNRT